MRPRPRPSAPADGQAEPPAGPQAASRRGVGRIVLQYAVFAGLWILLSDRLVRILVADPAAMMRASAMKGLLFVGITSGLLYATLTRYVKVLLAREAAAHQQEAEKARALQLLGALSEASPDAMYVKDEQGRYILFNQACGRIVGKAPAEVLGKDDRAIFPEAEARALMAVNRSVLENGDLVTVEETLTTTAGMTTFLTTKGPIRDAQGRVFALFGVARDITQRKRAEEALRNAEKLESIGSLAGGVAHDMNNVLAAIMGLASTLRQDCPDQDPRSATLDTIVRACTRGRDMVRSLLYFARKDMEAMGPVNLNAIAGEVAHLLSYTTLSRVVLSTDFQEPLGWIEGDAGALSHALINLCVNAVDAMPEGGALTLRTRQSAEGVVAITVQDTGAGMSPEVARRCVEPFFTTKPTGKGTGLGLAMVYGAVKAHQGTLAIRSEPGQGTEITLGFPLLAAAPAQAAVPAATAPAATVPLRILLVDDDELIRLSVGPMLAALGHEVGTAESGQEALLRLEAGLEVDLVILDMNMPGLNGAQTLERLLAFRPNQAVLMATGYSDDSIAPLLKGRPNLSSLRKPFTVGEFRTKLSALPNLRT